MSMLIADREYFVGSYAISSNRLLTRTVFSDLHFRIERRVVREKPNCWAVAHLVGERQDSAINSRYHFDTLEIPAKFVEFVVVAFWITLRHTVSVAPRSSPMPIDPESHCRY